jgi:phosphoribosylanthranilate isomerase
MIVKVCGMRDADNIRKVVKLGIDWIGFVFWQDSPRFVSQITSNAGIIPDYSSLCGNSVGDVKKVGVFVNDMPQNIVTRIVNYNLDIIQLHGQESPVMIDNLRATVDPDIHAGIKIMKAISISTRSDVARYKEYIGHVDYFLFDTKTPLVGGSGNQFDWSVLEAYDGDVPFLLSGGIGPDDINRIKTFHHPMCMGIDLNSKFEEEPAMKNVDKLKSFISELRN